MLAEFRAHDREEMKPQMNTARPFRPTTKLEDGRLRMEDRRKRSVTPASRRPVIEVDFFCLAGETPALQTRSQILAERRRNSTLVVQMPGSRWLVQLTQLYPFVKFVKS